MVEFVETYEAKRVWKASFWGEHTLPGTERAEEGVRVKSPPGVALGQSDDVVWSKAEDVPEKAFGGVVIPKDFRDFVLREIRNHSARLKKPNQKEVVVTVHLGEPVNWSQIGREVLGARFCAFEGFSPGKARYSHRGEITEFDRKAFKARLPDDVVPEFLCIDKLAPNQVRFDDGTVGRMTMDGKFVMISIPGNSWPRFIDPDGNPSNWDPSCYPITDESQRQRVREFALAHAPKPLAENQIRDPFGEVYELRWHNGEPQCRALPPYVGTWGSYQNPCADALAWFRANCPIDRFVTNDGRVLSFKMLDDGEAECADTGLRTYPPGTMEGMPPRIEEEDALYRFRDAERAKCPGCCETLRLPEQEPYVLDIQLEPTLEEFWASLTPERRLALAKAAPKVAGRWEDCGDEVWRRVRGIICVADAGRDYTDGDVGASVYLDDGCEIALGTFLSLPLAQSACDAELIRLGYVLEDGE